jgi:hypothetical protein
MSAEEEKMSNKLGFYEVNKTKFTL